jgi:hypothetical protein
VDGETARMGGRDDRERQSTRIEWDILEEGPVLSHYLDT